MTIIAWDGRIIAADGLVSAGGVITSRNHKKLLVEDNRIFGLAGGLGFMPHLVHWYKNGAKPGEAPKDTDWTFIVLEGGGVARCASNTFPYMDSYDPPWAWGSLWCVAYGAMLAGKTAVEAVEIMCRTDTECGGEIQAVNIDEVLGVDHKLAAE